MMTAPAVPPAPTLSPDSIRLIRTACEMFQGRVVSADLPGLLDAVRKAGLTDGAQTQLLLLAEDDHV
jgi:hypothetical protein